MSHDNHHNADMEFLTAAGIAATAGFTVSVGEKAYRYMKSREPMVVQILDSTTEEDWARIVVQIANQTLDGLYLEELSVSGVQAEDLVFLRWGVADDGGMGAPSYGWVEFDWQPKNIPPGDDFKFAFEFAKPADRKLYSSDLKIIFSRLNENKPDARTVTFRVR